MSGDQEIEGEVQLAPPRPLCSTCGAKLTLDGDEWICTDCWDKVDNRRDAAEAALRSLDPEDLADVLHWTLGSAGRFDPDLHQIAMTTIREMLGLPNSDEDHAKVERYRKVARGRHIRSGRKEEAHLFRLLDQKIRDLHRSMHDDDDDWSTAVKWLEHVIRRSPAARKRKPDVSAAALKKAMSRSRTGRVTDIAFAFGIVPADQKRRAVQRRVDAALKDA